MKIKKVNTYYVRPRWGFIEIITDDGLSGWGEAVLEGHCSTVFACVDEYKPYLIDKNPLNIEDIWETIYRAGFYRGGGIMTSALSGIDQALWDIKGKYFNAPVWQLMGGACRSKMKVYSWIGGDRPHNVAQEALKKKEAGFEAVKMNATDELQMLDSYSKIDAVLARVAAVREACGKDFGIAVDFHGRVHRPMAAILAKKLEEFDLMFIEEPVLCENLEMFKEIRRIANTPIATGERLYTKYDFKRLFEAGGVDIIQPDVDATSYNAVIQEQSMGIHYNVGREVLDYVLNKEDFKFEKGYVNLPSKPGIGVEVNKELVQEENKNPHSWKNPIWRHEDGSVAEW